MDVKRGHPVDRSGRTDQDQFSDSVWQLHGKVGSGKTTVRIANLAQLVKLQLVDQFCEPQQKIVK